MFEGYQPPKFQQFDGKETPKQHIYLTLSSLAMLQGHMTIVLLKSLFDLPEQMHLIGTQILNLILKIVGSDKSNSSLIVFIAQDVPLV